jgi:hypothetical protein
MHILIYHPYYQYVKALPSIFLLIVLQIQPPTAHPPPPQIYASFAEMHGAAVNPSAPANPSPGLIRTPSSSRGGSTPAKTNGWKPVNTDAVAKAQPDLS